MPRVWTPSATAQQAAGQPDAPAHINADWAGQVTEWLVQHRTYPTDARLRHIQGMVVIRFTVASDGRVLDVTVTRGSGSAALDQAAADMLHHARLPPFPPDMNQPKQAVTVPIRYYLD